MTSFITGILQQISVQWEEWESSVTHMREMRHAYTNLVENMERRNNLGGQRVYVRIILNINVCHELDLSLFV